MSAFGMGHVRGGALDVQQVIVRQKERLLPRALLASYSDSPAFRGSGVVTGGGGGGGEGPARLAA